jgi:hypothetical protein
MPSPASFRAYIKHRKIDIMNEFEEVSFEMWLLTSVSSLAWGAGRLTMLSWTRNSIDTSENA